MQDGMAPPPISDRGSVPVPDPTRLTTDAVRAATEQWRRDLDSFADIVNTRIDGMDKATDLRMKHSDEMPSLVRDAVEHIKELYVEKFDSIALQFSERDIRTIQAQVASSDALAAALQAAKELVNAQGEASAAAAVKSETSFTKQIDQIGTIIQTLEKALDARITELKERIDRGEGSESGTHSAHIEYRENASVRQGGQQVIMAVIAGFIAILAVVVSIAIAYHK